MLDLDLGMADVKSFLTFRKMSVMVECQWDWVRDHPGDTSLGTPARDYQVCLSLSKLVGDYLD